MFFKFILIHQKLSLGFSFTFGALIDESLGAHHDKNYALKQTGSYARTLIVFKWMFVGFFLTISYKSVLRAMLMNVYYENTIDTIDDMLQSDRMFGIANDTFQKHLVLSDPRVKVQQLAKRVFFYKFGTGRLDEIKDIRKG